MYSGIFELSNFSEQEHKELSGLGLHTPSKRCAFFDAGERRSLGCSFVVESKMFTRVVRKVVSSVNLSARGARKRPC